MDSRFTGRVAIVTGGASGIGEAIARRIFAEGGQVAIFDMDRAGLDRMAGEVGVTPVVVNVGDEQAVEEGVGMNNR